MNLNNKKFIKKKETINLVYTIITPNNILFTITDIFGKTILKYSAGAAGYKGHQKKSSTGISMTAFTIAQNAVEKKIKKVILIFKGIRKGRKDALTGLQNGGLQITELRDLTPIPHNGCKKRKKRRL